METIKTYHTFTVESTQSSSSEGIHPQVNMKINGDASISDMLEAFDCFLKALSYHPPENATLDYVQDFGCKGKLELKSIYDQDFGEF